MSKTFCIAPWHDVHVQTDGIFRGCCVMGQGPDKGLLKKDGEFVEISHGIHAGVNSDTAKELRLACLNDEWHPECERCQSEESAGMRSMRQMYDERWSHLFNEEDARKITDEETGEITDPDHVPFYYDIQLGNLCNLKCRMCSPMLSSSWIPDAMKMQNKGNQGDTFTTKTFSGKQITIEHIKGKQYNVTPDPFAWANSDEFWEQMSNIKSKIKHLYFIGGEPMMIHRHFDFLKECVESGDAAHITLQYDTNLTNIHDHVIEYWKKFELVEIGASIDGMGKELTYMRHPVKWEHILKNLEKIDALGYEHKNIKCLDSVTVNIYNVLHILDYIEWKIKSGKYKFKSMWQKHSLNLGVHPLHIPRYLSVTILSPEAKEIVTQRYKDWRERMLKWMDEEGEYTDQQEMQFLRRNLSNWVDQWITFINNEDHSHLIPDFFEFNNSLDNIRDEKFNDVFPELFELLDTHRGTGSWHMHPIENKPHYTKSIKDER